MASLTASPDSEVPFVLEGPQVVREGDVLAHTLAWPQFTSISTGGTEVYVNGSTQTAAWLSTGTTSVSGNITTPPTITIPAGLGGLKAVVEVRGVSGGETKSMGIIHIVLRPGAEA